MPTPTDPLTDSDAITALAGSLGIDLRTDDATDQNQINDWLLRAVNYGSGQVYFYLQGKYTAVTGSQWCMDVATAFACLWLAMRRYNDAPATIMQMCDEYKEQLNLILTGKAQLAVVPEVFYAKTVFYYFFK